MKTCIGCVLVLAMFQVVSAAAQHPSGPESGRPGFFPTCLDYYDTLTISFEASDGSTAAVSYDVTDFTWSPQLGEGSLTDSFDVAAVNVEDYEFTCYIKYAAAPYVVQFQHEFENRDQTGPRRGDRELDWTEYVIVTVEVSRLDIEERDDYVMTYGRHSHHFCAYDDDGSWFHGRYEYPSIYGAVNWWCRLNDEDHLVQGGLIEATCDQRDCWVTVVGTWQHWGMGTGDNDQIWMTNECAYADLSYHTQEMKMLVSIQDDDKRVASHHVWRDGCSHE